MTAIDNPSSRVANSYIDPYLDVPANDPYIIVSADSHAGLPTAEYRGYLEKKFHPQFDEFLAEREQALEQSTMLGTRNEDYAKKWFEEHEEALRSGWEAGRRDQELDGDGVADIINNPVDAIGSVANYFKEHGWKNGEPVALPATARQDYDVSLIDAVLKPAYTVGKIEGAGFIPTQQLPADARATIMGLQGEEGMEFWIGLYNFYVITRYNHSHLYGMAVFQLSESF